MERRKLGRKGAVMSKNELMKLDRNALMKREQSFLSRDAQKLDKALAMLRNDKIIRAAAEREAPEVYDWEAKTEDHPYMMNEFMEETRIVDPMTGFIEERRIIRRNVVCSNKKR
jgi:hypothetical protein